jgi:hypothetical protein
MESFLKKLDLFGSNCSFLMNSKKRNSSWIGGMIVIMMIGLCSVFVFYQIYLWLTTGNVIRFFQFNYSKKPEILLKDYDDFMLAICSGTDDNSTNYDPFISDSFKESLVWEYNYRLPWFINGKIEIPLRQCKNKHFPHKLINQFNMRDFINCRCARHEDLKDYNISFSYKDSYSSFLSYQVRLKDEVYNNLSLYNNISKIIQENPPRKYIYFVDSVADLNVFTEDFFTNYLNYHTSYISLSLNNLYEIYLNTISVIVSDSLVVNEGI